MHLRARAKLSHPKKVPALAWMGADAERFFAGWEGRRRAAECKDVAGLSGLQASRLSGAASAKKRASQAHAASGGTGTDP